MSGDNIMLTPILSGEKGFCKMAEEKKKYPAGLVMLSVEEFKDLVRENAENAAEKNKFLNKWYEEKGRADRLDKELADLRASIIVEVT